MHVCTGRSVGGGGGDVGGGDGVSSSVQFISNIENIIQTNNKFEQ